MRGLLLSLLALGCGPSPLPEGRWDQCPPAGVEPQECVLDRGSQSFFLTGDDRVREQTLALLDEICNSPCVAIDDLYISNGYAESPFSTIEVWKPLRKLKRARRLNIALAPGLKNFRGLESLESVGDLVLDKLPDLESFEGLENVVELDSLEVNEVGAASFRGLSGLQRVQREMRLDAMPRLTDLSEFADVVVGPGTEDPERFWKSAQVLIRRNPLLVGLSGAFARQTALGKFIVGSNASLAMLDALSPSSRVGAVEIYDNGLLKRCTIDDFLAQHRLDEEPYVHENGSSAGCP